MDNMAKMVRTWTIEEIFKGRIFTIPDYQRGYSWGDKQLKDFWDDLSNLREKQHHYMGVLTFKEEGKDGCFDVIDGQQRLITALILIKEILNNANERRIKKLGTKKSSLSISDWEKTFLFKGRKVKVIYDDNDINKHFNNITLKNYDPKSNRSDKYVENKYTKNLDDAKKFFEGKVKNLTQDRLQRIFNKITEHFRFIPYKVSSEMNVHLAFEAINNRGKSLSFLEILKNRLLYLVKPKNDDNEQAGDSKECKQIKECWGLIYSSFGKLDKFFDEGAENTFLEQHATMFYNLGEKINAEDRFKKHFLDQKFPTTNPSIKNIQDYVKSLEDSIIPWCCLHDPYCSEAKKYQTTKKTRGSIDRYNRLSYTHSRHLLLCCMLKDPSKLLQMLETLERFSFLIHGLLRHKAKTFEDDIRNLSHELYKEKKTFKKVKKEIEKLVNKKFKTDVYNLSNVGTFSEQLADMLKNSSNIKYLLYEYNRSLLRDKDLKWEGKDLKWEDSSVEHIYPQTNDTPGWREPFCKYDDNQRTQLLKSLGNLLVIDETTNKRIKNKCFDDKKKEYKKVSPDACKVAKKTKWNAARIKKRGIKLLNFLIAEWDILKILKKNNYTTREKYTPQERVRILGLDSVFYDKHKQRNP